MSAIRGEVVLEPLPQFRGVDSDYIVLAGVVMRGTTEDRDANLLFVEVRPPFFDCLFSDVKKKFAKAGGSPKLGASRHTVQERQPLI